MNDNWIDCRIVWSKLCWVSVVSDDLFCEEKDIAIVCNDSKYGLVHIQRQTNAEKSELYFYDKCIIPCIFDIIYPLYKEREASFFVAYSGEKCCLLALKCACYEAGGEVMCEEILPCLYEHITWDQTQADALILYGDEGAQKYDVITRMVSML